MKQASLAAVASRPSVLIAALAACVSLNFQILLPVVPAIAEKAGPHGVGGAATAGLSIGAVIGELLTPWLMSRITSRRLLVFGQLLTAASSLVYVIPALSAAVMIVAALGRGLGMGIVIVVAVATLSDLTAPDRRGTAIGRIGLALSLPGVFVPSAGVYLLSLGRLDLDAAIATASGLAGALVALAIPNHTAHASEASAGLLAMARQPRLLFVLAGFVLASSSFGGLFTFAPIVLPAKGIGSAAVFLLAAGASRAVSRWLAGPLGDRRPIRQIVLAADALVLASLVLLALHVGGAALLTAGLVYGIGYGAIQTTAFLALTQSTSLRGAGALSALWNSGTDLGSALGGGMLGLAAARYGYLNAVWVLPVSVLVSAVLLAAALEPGRRVNDAPVAVVK